LDSPSTLDTLCEYDFDAFGTQAVYDYLQIIRQTQGDRNLLQLRLKEYISTAMVGAQVREILDVFCPIYSTCVKLEAFMKVMQTQRLAGIGMDQFGRLLLEVDFEVEV